MPELPEVTTIVVDLNEKVKDSVIREIWWDEAKLLRPSSSVFVEAVKDKKIISVSRRAKLVIFELSQNNFLIIHLKLTGRLLVRQRKDPKDQWVHVVLTLKDGREIRYADIRKFGWLKVVRDKNELETLFSEFGPEPLSDNLTSEGFSRILSRSSGAIKQYLTDQAVFAGIGNIYADESLYRARIHPQTPANSLLPKKASELFQSIREVLKEAIKYRGTSVDAYVDTQGEKGQFETRLRVYGQEGKPCKTCQTPIKKIKLGGRGTHFCPTCQKR